jgi:hypothetical protein
MKYEHSKKKKEEIDIHLKKNHKYTQLSVVNSHAIYLLLLFWKKKKKKKKIERKRKKVNDEIDHFF